MRQEPAAAPPPEPDPAPPPPDAPEGAPPAAGAEGAGPASPEAAAAAWTVRVRYGLMLATEHFVSATGRLSAGEPVIIRSARGMDWGEVAQRPRPAPHGPRGLGELVRRASPEDMAVLRHIKEVKEPEERRAGLEAIAARGLQMRLVAVEHLFSGEKIIYYFLAERRVDFRELVKDLARRFRTRIEMRQIGVRDEARILSEYEHCGRELCCRTFLRQLEPVTIRMAKIQKTTLDPSKISGHCGRLMCCLRYEDEVYGRLAADLPPRGAQVTAGRHSGEVVALDILRQEATLLLPGGDRETVHVSQITGTRPRPRPAAPARPPAAGDGAGRAAAGDPGSQDRGPP